VRTRTVGRVSMDMLTVDLGPLAEAGQHLGLGTGTANEVTLWGRSSQGAVLDIDEVARHAGTLGYELMCALAPRVPVSAAVPPGASDD
jgi:alanine racemase